MTSFPSTLACARTQTTRTSSLCHLTNQRESARKGTARSSSSSTRRPPPVIERVEELLQPGEPTLAAVRRRVWVDHRAARWFSDSAEAWAAQELLLYRARQREERLFYPDIDLSDRLRWDAINAEWWGRTIVVCSDGNFDDKPNVGVFSRIGPGMLGASLHLMHIGCHGSTTCIDPRNVWEMFELPECFREPKGRWDEDDFYDDGY